MQTFVPYDSAAESAMVLDLKRLGKQIIESRQIGLAITNPDYGWQSHPAVNMWRGHLAGLMHYNAAMAAEWHDRRDKQHGAWVNMLSDHGAIMDESDYPSWWGDYSVHNSHRSRLVAKDPEHYRKFWPTIPDSLEYVWPLP